MKPPPPSLTAAARFLWLGLTVVLTPELSAQVRPLLPPVAAAADAAMHQADIRAGQGAAEVWLRFLDAGEYGKSWQEAARHFQGTVTEADWAGGMASKRLPMGKALSRKLLEARFSMVVPGGEQGRYVFIQFQTDFENKKSAVETLVPMLEKDGRWKVAGYYIK